MTDGLRAIDLDGLEPDPPAPDSAPVIASASGWHTVTATVGAGGTGAYATPSAPPTTAKVSALGVAAIFCATFVAGVGVMAAYEWWFSPPPAPSEWNQRAEQAIKESQPASTTWLGDWTLALRAAGVKPDEPLPACDPDYTGTNAAGQRVTKQGRACAHTVAVGTPASYDCAPAVAVGTASGVTYTCTNTVITGAGGYGGKLPK